MNWREGWKPKQIDTTPDVGDSEQAWKIDVALRQRGAGKGGGGSSWSTLVDPPWGRCVLHTAQHHSITSGTRCWPKILWHWVKCSSAAVGKIPPWIRGKRLTSALIIESDYRVNCRFAIGPFGGNPLSSTSGSLPSENKSGASRVPSLVCVSRRPDVIWLTLKFMR